MRILSALLTCRIEKLTTCLEKNCISQIQIAYVLDVRILKLICLTFRSPEEDDVGH